MERLLLLPCPASPCLASRPDSYRPNLHLLGRFLGRPTGPKLQLGPESGPASGPAGAFRGRGVGTCVIPDLPGTLESSNARRYRPQSKFYRQKKCRFYRPKLLLIDKRALKRLKVQFFDQKRTL